MSYSFMIWKNDDDDLKRYTRNLSRYCHFFLAIHSLLNYEMQNICKEVLQKGLPERISIHLNIIIKKDDNELN